MPSPIDKAKLVPASENDAINPGCFYLACLNLQRKTDPDSYWVVLRAPREWLPNGFFDTRPVQARVFPFWIVGKYQRVWLPRTSLFYLDESQRTIFVDRQKRHDFRKFIILINGFRNTHQALACFEREILASTRSYNERRERLDRSTTDSGRSRSLSAFMEDYVDSGNDGSADDVIPEMPAISACIRDNSSARKRQRRESIHTNKHSSKGTAPHHIKSEQEQEQDHHLVVKAIMDSERVSVYFGRNNEVYIADAAAICQSAPYLNSMISTNNDEGKYIMHPRLRDVDAADFRSVLQYIHINEYQPKLIPNPDGRPNGPMGLEGLATREEYSAALIQAGRLILLSKNFHLDKLEELVTKKVMKAEYKSFSDLSVIEFARLVLSRPQQANGTTEDGPLVPARLETADKWAVERLAENFMRIMNSENERNQYVEMIEATAERRIHAEVLERAALNFRIMGANYSFLSDNEE